MVKRVIYMSKAAILYNRIYFKDVMDAAKKHIIFNSKE